ncbi:hypothetical protein [Patulibacter sp.]|nr:hypothetical protein [Patulibacter sp.]MDO9408763.1 hypothetical protein [Patulibacter sp.]
MHGVPPVPHQVLAVVPVASASGTIGGIVGFLVVLGVVAVLLRSRRR